MRLCVLERWRPWQLTEPRACGERCSAQKLRRGHPLFALELNIHQFKPGFAGAGNKKR